MQKIALGIEYDGSDFHGWQRQVSIRTVQACVEAAISKVAGQTITTICAGRTDSGVHAEEQVVHFETSVQRDFDAWVFGTNTYLPRDICVRWARVVSLDFSARFSALARHYRYIICNQSIRPALNRHVMTWEYRPLDVQKMREASVHFLGEHDFSSFRAAECQSKTPIRRVDSLTVHRQGNLITIDIKANAFLHHMVRNIAGVLMEIGRGRQQPNWVQDVLAARERRAAARTAPAQGLCLVKVDYPEDYFLAKTS